MDIQEFQSLLKQQHTSQEAKKIIDAFLQWLSLHVDEVADINNSSTGDVYDAIDALSSLTGGQEES